MYLNLAPRAHFPVFAKAREKRPGGRGWKYIVNNSIAVKLQTLFSNTSTLIFINLNVDELQYRQYLVQDGVPIDRYPQDPRDKASFPKAIKIFQVSWSQVLIAVVHVTRPDKHSVISFLVALLWCYFRFYLKRDTSIHCSSKCITIVS